MSKQAKTTAVYNMISRQTANKPLSPENKANPAIFVPV